MLLRDISSRLMNEIIMLQIYQTQIHSIVLVLLNCSISVIRISISISIIVGVIICICISVSVSVWSELDKSSWVRGECGELE